MPLTLTATADPATASVVLDVNGAASTLTLTRTDVNGTAAVRLRVDDTPAAGHLLTRDHEPALLGTVTYEAVSGSETATAAVVLDLTGPARIHSVQYPTISTTPEMVTGYDAARGSLSVVHWPQGRPDPVVIDAPARTREGTLTAVARSHADAVDVQATLRPGYALMLRQSDHPGFDMHFRVTESTIRPLELLEDGWAWEVAARFVETRSPSLPLLGSVGWSFDDIASSYASFAAVRAAFDDFAGLTLGPEYA